MSMIYVMMLLASPYEGVLPEGLELTCTFDAPTIRLGDLAYCKVQVRNQGEVSRKVSILTPWNGLWFKIRAVEELLAVNDTREWSSGGGGGFGGGGTLVLLPGESLVGWMRVPLFTAESLREMRDGPIPQQLRLLAMYHQVVSHYPVATLPIRGNISKNPRGADLVSKLYVPYKEHPKKLAGWDEFEGLTPTFLNSEGMSQIPWMYNTPQGLQEVREQLDEKSAMCRAVRILQAQQACTFARSEDKKKVMEELLKELQRCGPAEKEWYTRGQIHQQFRLARDFESERLFRDHYPRTLWPYERYTADGRLEPITADEARYGRRAGISVSE